MNRLLGIALGSIMAMMGVASLIGRSGQPDVPPSVTAAAAAKPGAMATDLPETAMALKRDNSGQFHIGGEVNGQSVRFLVDTGADVLALTEDSAEAAGITVDAEAFQPIMQTASGTGYGAPIAIDTLKLGESEFHNVEGVVVQGLSTNLLGQNVLRKLGRVTLQGDRMVIQPR